MSIEYTPLEKAAEIIGNRRSDAALQKKLMDLVLKEFREGPFSADYQGLPAVRAEYLARPTAGDLDYIESGQSAGLSPWTATYVADEYAKGTNPKKANMYRPRLILPKGQSAKLKVVNENMRAGEERLGCMPTFFGISLSEWWLKLRAYKLREEGKSEVVDMVFDLSEWYDGQAKQAGFNGSATSKAAYYYPALMGMYAARAVLFCDFDAYPSFKYASSGFKAAQENFGVNPVIVKWSPYRLYPAKENGRATEEFSVDLSNEIGLTYDGLNDWLRREAKCVSDSE